MSASPDDLQPDSWDVVQTSERAGVRVTWMRRRGQGDAKHRIVMQPLDSDEQAEELGPHDRREAALVFESVQAALLVAARQQRSRLSDIMQRRHRASAVLAGRDE